MMFGVEDKIRAAVWQQAKSLAKYDLLSLGGNARFDGFALLSKVVEASSASRSLESLSEGPDADSVFHHLRKLSVEDVLEMLKSNVRRLVALLKRRDGDRRFAVAVDYTEEMYYGEKDNPFVVGTKHKSGSNYAYRFLTVNVVTKGRRYFLFSLPVFERGNNHVFVDKSLEFLKELGVKVYVLLMDREFNDSQTIALLNDEEVPYITPADHDERFYRWVKIAGRLPAIAREWKIGKLEVETTLIILQEGDEVYGYFTNLPEADYADDPYHLSDLYSKRWGIETGHRVDDQYRIFSTTKNGIIRYLFFVVSILLYNLWVWTNLTFGLAGKNWVTTNDIKDVLRQSFDEFNEWLKSPERWLTSLTQTIQKGWFAAQKLTTA